MSRRMGRPKQLLPVAGTPLLIAAAAPLAQSAADGLIVVTTSAIAERIDWTVLANTTVVLSDAPSSEMIDSIRLGMEAWAKRCPLGPGDGFLVCPGDQPGISIADVDACLRAFRAAPDGIIIAARERRRGHPIIFPGSFAGFVRSAACDGGLSALPRGHADRVRLVECATAAVVRDVDTDADYKRLA